MFHFEAGKEVIVSAGALNSPQILMLSGIGPEDELRKHGVPLVKALRGVGKNLQAGFILKWDHVQFRFQKLSGVNIY